VIRVLLLDRYRETIDAYLQMWARNLDERLRAVPYESLFPSDVIEGSAFIFSDLERLKEPEHQRVDDLARRIESAGGHVLNRPSRVLRRYALLRSLHDSGRNPFNVYRPARIDGPLRFPVFIRRERAHSGPLTPLLKNADELNRALAELKASSPITDDFLIVEYVHTAENPDGLFRKYSAMLIGQTLVPRHILFSPNWIDKDADVVTDAVVVEENQYLADFPHAPQVREIFESAAIDYGRIDYSLLSGNVVTWEINTNPRVMPSPGRCDLRRLQRQAISARLVLEAFLELEKTKSVTVPLTGFQRIVSRSDMSPARRLIYTASRFWKRLGSSRTGRRIMEGITSSIRFGIDQNPPPS
jgi:hypothetical protein